MDRSICLSTPTLHRVLIFVGLVLGCYLVPLLSCAASEMRWWQPRSKRCVVPNVFQSRLLCMRNGRWGGRCMRSCVLCHPACTRSCATAHACRALPHPRSVCERQCVFEKMCVCVCVCVCECVCVYKCQCVLVCVCVCACNIYGYVCVRMCVCERV